MHASSSSSFFTLFFAYLAYLSFLSNALRGSDTIPPFVVAVLLAVPLMIPAYQCMKWLVTNEALKRAAQELPSPSDDRKTLYDRLYGREGLHTGGLGSLWWVITNHAIGKVAAYGVFFVGSSCMDLPCTRSSFAGETNVPHNNRLELTRPAMARWRGPRSSTGWCDQERLYASSGRQSHQGKSQKPCSWMAARRETE
jgi:hypothetical protein